MAEQTVLVELKVSSEQAVENMTNAKGLLESLKQDQENLDQQYRDGQKTRAEYVKELTSIKTSMEEQKNIIKANSDALKQNVREQKSNKDSLVAMRAELKKMTTAYDNLSKAEREGAAGQELQQKISVLTTEITKAEEATGRFQRNVGNYSNSIMKAFVSVGSAAGGPMANGIKSATGAMKVMAANPIIAVLSLLVTIIGKVVSSLKNNEEAMNRVTMAFSAFRGVGVIVQKVVDALANGIAWLAEKLGNLLAKITDAKEELKEEQELTKEEIKLKQQQRKLELDLAKNENKISELRLKATQKSKYSAAERAQFIKEAQKTEEANYKLRVSVATKELELIRRRNAQAASGTKDIDAEYAAEARLLQLQTEHNNNLASLVKKEESFTAAMSKETKEVKQEAAAIEYSNERLKERADLLGMVNKEFAAMDETGKAAMKAEQAAMDFFSELDRINAEDESMQQQIDMAWEVYNDEASSYDARLEAYKEYVKLAKEQDEALKESKAAAINAAVDAMGTLSDIASQYGAQSKAAAIASKALALGQIAVETGVATAKGIAQAQSVPFPANIGAIATTIATILSGIGAATKSVKSAKFATGGYISGPGTGTSDSIPAMLSNGESVINAKSTRMFYPLLSAINEAGGGVAFGKANGSGRYAVGGTVTTDALAGSFRTSQMEGMMEAIASMQPVVSVREITKAQNRVSIKEAISRQ